MKHLLSILIFFSFMSVANAAIYIDCEYEKTILYGVPSKGLERTQDNQLENITLEIFEKETTSGFDNISDGFLRIDGRGGYKYFESAFNLFFIRNVKNEHTDFPEIESKYAYNLNRINGDLIIKYASFKTPAENFFLDDDGFGLISEDFFNCKRVDKLF